MLAPAAGDEGKVRRETQELAFKDRLLVQQRGRVGGHDVLPGGAKARRNRVEGVSGPDDVGAADGEALPWRLRIRGRRERGLGLGFRVGARWSELRVEL